MEALLWITCIVVGAVGMHHEGTDVRTILSLLGLSFCMGALWGYFGDRIKAWFSKEKK